MRILGDRLLLSPLPVKTKSDGGIHLPDGQAGDKMVYWRVEQTGSKVKDDCFHPGVIVLTPLYFSHTTLEDGSGRKIVDCNQIEAMLEPDTPDI